ncbi:hypothetical protein FRB98_006656 [Tulasnella sp. 332]|nr:hypothetical protein FRB98_006656 [Tulasnella sp. 332]
MSSISLLVVIKNLPAEGREHLDTRKGIQEGVFEVFWKDRKAGQWTPAIESTKRASTRQASFLGQRRPPPINAPPDEHRHSRFFDANLKDYRES